MNEYINDKIELPVSFRVFGIGEKTLPILNEIDSWGYKGVKTILYGKDEISPAEEDEIVIFINPDNYDISLMTQSFFQANILTLVIATPGFTEITNSYDAVCFTDHSNIKVTVFGILYPLFHFGPISYDFNDISSTLKDSGKFTIKTYQCKTSKNKIDEIVKKLKKDLVNLDIIENLTFIISYNPSSNLPLTVDELNPLQTFFTSLNENINIKWGVQFDDSLDSNELQLSLIASGKDIKI